MGRRPNMKQVIIKDIAREAGVFIASVSRALNGMDGISEKKRSRILRVCERLSYTPNGLARSLVKRRTQTIGIIMPDIMSPFYSELMVKASDAAHKRGYQVLLCNSFRELRAERDYLKLLAEHQVEGILIFPIGPRSTESMSEFIHNVPMVALNELTGQCGIPYVCADEEQAGSIAVVKNMPFASRAGTSNMLQISTELEEAAQVENAGFPRRFFKIVFPLSKGGMISGFMLVFISIMKELDLIVILMTPSQQTLPYMAYAYSAENLIQLSSAVTIVMFVLVFFVYWFANTFTDADITKGF
jgi:transcriptional regulator with XRE-family HTH domain